MRSALVAANWLRRMEIGPALLLAAGADSDSIRGCGGAIRARESFGRAVLAFGIVVSICSFILPLAADAQQTGKAWRVGYLGNTPTIDPDAARTWEAFRQELQERGYVERLDVDVIVALTNPAAHAAKQATATIPIVMISVDDPVGTGLIASLAHPIGNMTGVADYALDLVPKRLELLKAAVPTASRIAFIRCLKCVASDEVAKEAA